MGLVGTQWDRYVGGCAVTPPLKCGDRDELLNCHSPSPADTLPWLPTLHPRIDLCTSWIIDQLPSVHIKRAMDFALQRARQLRTKLGENPSDREGLNTIFQDCETMAARLPLVKPSDKERYKILHTPLWLFGLHCEICTVMEERESAEELLSLLPSCWVAVQTTLLSIERPQRLKVGKNIDSIKATVANLETFNQGVNDQAYQDVMAGNFYSVGLQREDQNLHLKQALYIGFLEDTLKLVRRISQEHSPNRLGQS
ncbi:hypothetical protein CI238_13250 [Colletotrichum incanum]|uniref:Uncharacterized protein n=1 Tax=Colletotrichum incanum TaxID=1573173 RepID=A0A167A0U5_COLIC|nr:hypothetical protein CI238_13250 [Colletotrichum incanum]